MTMLLRIARQGDAAALVETIEQHLHLERGEVLHLVDGDMPVAQRSLGRGRQRADAQLPGAQQAAHDPRHRAPPGPPVAGEPGVQLLVALAIPIGGALTISSVRERVRRPLRRTPLRAAPPGTATLAQSSSTCAGRRLGRDALRSAFAAPPAWQDAASGVARAPAYPRARAAAAWETAAPTCSAAQSWKVRTCTRSTPSAGSTWLT